MNAIRSQKRSRRRGYRSLYVRHEEAAAAAVVLALRMQVDEGLTVVRGSSLGGSSLGGSSLESTARGGVSNETERIALGGLAGCGAFCECRYFTERCLLRADGFEFHDGAL